MAACLVLAVSAAPAAAKIEFLRAWGGPGKGNGQFDLPGGIAVDRAGDVFVTDRKNFRIQKFSGDGRFIYAYGTIYATQDQLHEPSDVTIDPEGRVWIAEANGVRKYNSTPTALEPIRRFGSIGSGFGQFRQIAGIAAQPGPDSGDLYVADSRLNRIDVFSSMGTFITSWESYVSDIATGPNGDVYVTDPINNRVKVISPAGRFVRKWGGTGSGPGKFSHPQAVAVAPDGSVYVSDLGHYRIEKFNSQGRFEAAWGSKGSGPGEFTHGPGDIGIGPGGLIYVTDYGASRIEEFRDTDMRAALWEESR